MAGLGAIRGMFGAVLLCSLLALIFLIIGLVVPEWATLKNKNKTDLNKLTSREFKVGLFEFSFSGKCNTQECEDGWVDATDSVSEPLCKGRMILRTGKSDHAECSYYGKGYCRCPFPEDNWTIEKGSSTDDKSGGCNKDLNDDVDASNQKEYNEQTASALSLTVTMLIIAIILVFLAIVLALVGAITAKWILGIVGAIFLCLALIFAIVAIISGTSFGTKYFLGQFNLCGSQDAWDKVQEAANEHTKTSINNFSTGPIFVLIGIIFLFVACVLDCMVSGLAKKIHKVADIDGDGRIG